MTEDGSRQSGRNGRQFAQQRPGWLLADDEVGVVGVERLLVGGQGDAGCQAGADEGGEQVEFQVCEGQGGVVASHHVSGGGQWIGLVEHGVSGGDCQLKNGGGVHHVAKINQPGDAARLLAPGRDQHVVVVGVAVDDALAQFRQTGNHLVLKMFQYVLDERKLIRLLNSVDALADGFTGKGHVPMQMAVHGGMAEIGKSDGGASQKVTQIIKQVGAVGGNERQGNAGQVSE